MFKKAERRDLETLKAMAKEVIRTNYVSFLGDELVSNFIDSGASDAEIEQGLKHCDILQAEGSGEILGFVVINDDLLHLIMVSPTAQRQGYGAKLLKFAEQKMLKQYERITLQTFSKNTQALNFYLKNGWREIDRQDVAEMNMQMVILEKRK